MTTSTNLDTGPGLRTALRVDGWSTGAFGLFLLATAPALSEPLGLPTSWSVPFGVAMLGGAAALLLIAGYREIPARLAGAVVAVNAAAAVVMVELACTDLMPLTGWGRAFLVVGAVFVAAFAALEYAGLRRGDR
ncbi:hypothetical protein ACWDYH_34470 [Nocardia goodfellowii]|uniref:Peptidoglycan/LPS O-acetylase OafA/YrhL n=1 Tax=Nocardia goodfellowii TaxID=882446 RepID=A0ABS4QFV8_9NOCA|nr:hypothetical protein [Nocardia goodfellowii]MBP2190594.1 peptidoglycan/LPS O-acetylase OafA/YrhL [Nocardia goodfellowii]